MPPHMEHLAASTDSGITEPTPDIIERAAEWMAHLESGDANEADRTSFERWISEHPAHAIAIERMGGLGNSSEVERETLRRLFLRPRRRVGGVLAIALLAGGGWFLSRLPAVQVHFADERTIVGEMRDVPLIDGSRIVLASDSVVDLDVDHGQRTVRLLRGELLAEVAKSHAVRFQVETSDGTAEARGTAFTVRKDDHATMVAVIASQVRACPVSAGQGQCVTLSPGEQARIADGAVVRLAKVVPGDVGAWTEGWLPVDDKPLPEVLDELNRWRKTSIRFDRQSLSALRVSGIFPLRDTDGALANLAQSQPIAVDWSDPASPVIRRSPE